MPVQLPAVSAVFVNRNADRAAFHDLLDRPTDIACPRVVVVTGMPGVGKSAAAARWAHEVRPRFGDGQLYVDVERLACRGAAAVSDVLRGFVEALGAHGGRIPADLAGLTAAYRQRTAGLRLLVVVDGVEFPSQVTPLLPASEDSLVVVTSHHRLTALLADGADLLTLRPLAPADGVELISRMVGPARLSREPEAAAEMVRLCGGLPIALRVVGAQLKAGPHLAMADVAARLRDERGRLDRLSLEGDPVIEAALEVAYAALPADARALYRVLGLHPGREFGGPVAVAATGLPPDVVEDALAVLLSANLVEAVGDGRYRIHELVRIHAFRCAESEQSPQWRDDVARRVVDAYLRGAAVADRVAMGSRMRLSEQAGWAERLLGATRAGRTDQGGRTGRSGQGDHDAGRGDDDVPLAGSAVDPARLSSPGAALDWLESERSNLLDAVRTASARGWDTAVWELCEALWVLYYNRKHYPEWLESHELAVAAAARLGHQAAEARMRSQLGRALVELERFAEAEAQFEEAIRLARVAVNRRVEASVLEFVGRARFEQADYPAAIAAFERSRSMNADLGNARGVALQTHHLGRALAGSGRSAEAAAVLAEALAGFEALPDEHNQARVLISLGEVHCDLARYADAERALAAAIDIMRRRGVPFQVALASEVLADVAAATGDHLAARRHREEALTAYTDAGSPRAHRLREALLADTNPAT
ncbi:tetratricopeptide repeat protein [Frankia sp. CiP1_Cm_nod1]|uniref:tetratricopeptide repeat protein n=1 Tax=Frankia sp. CiP1_Cm_nod1 TaxID=2897160 RepID=UPI0020257538